jgi:hypothetical protein
MNTNVIEPITTEGMGTEKQNGDITMEKVYTFRKLNGKDTFLMFKIIGKIGINEFTECLGKDSVKQMIQKFTAGNDNAGITMVGVSVILEMANVIISNLPKCEAEIYQMLSSTSNLTVEQVKDLDFVTFAEMVIDFIKKEEFKDFIKVVSKSFKLGN